MRESDPLKKRRQIQFNRKGAENTEFRSERFIINIILAQKFVCGGSIFQTFRGIEAKRRATVGTAFYEAGGQRLED
jgi:hypothetical protein